MATTSSSSPTCCLVPAGAARLNVLDAHVSLHATRPQVGGCLKMADERSRPPYSQPSLVPADYAWPRLLARDGDALFDHYRHMGNEKGTLGLIFGKAQNAFRDAGVWT